MKLLKCSMKGIYIFLLLILCISSKLEAKGKEVCNILILSGRNNHDWQKTTPFLATLFVDSGCFEVNVTNQPDTLSFNILKKYDVVVSNWNSWPENDFRWSAKAETGILKYVEDGGGLVFFHASSSVLYEWTDFKKISTGAWIDSTWHGKSSPVKVEIENQEHPITKGLLDFYIFDELWVNSEQNEKFHVLGSAINKGVTNKGLKKQPAIFVSNFGKGRIFHTLLGHNMRSMRNTGFQTLILRGAEWAANKKVTLPIPKELQQSKASDLSEFTWLENDSTFALFENDQVLWRFNFNTFHGKPFFHPIYINSNRITCVSPDDHPWHLGLWFSWKYINGKNYWEYIGESCESEGITEIKSAKLEKMADYMAKITLKINYYTSKQEVVLNETRIIHVSSPKKDGRIHMDYDFNFEALADSVDLNRTPLLGEPEGKSWGGYAGLSIRFNQDFMNSKIISSFGEDNDVNGKIGDWLYMGFKGLDGNLVGSAIMIPGETKREGEAWYSVNNPEFPFYYFSPAYLYLKPQLLKKGERIKLKYRILHLEGDVKREELKNEYDNYLNSITN